MYLGYARTHLDELGVLKPTWSAPLTAEKRTSIRRGCRTAELTSWESRQLKGATYGLPFYVWVCSFGRIRRGTLGRELIPVCLCAVQFSIVRFVFGTCSYPPPHFSLPPSLLLQPPFTYTNLFSLWWGTLSAVCWLLFTPVLCVACRLPLHWPLFIFTLFFLHLPTQFRRLCPFLSR